METPEQAEAAIAALHGSPELGFPTIVVTHAHHTGKEAAAHAPSAPEPAPPAATTLLPQRLQGPGPVHAAQC